jgi:hypothetical protein
MSTDFRFPNRPIYPPAVRFGPCDEPHLHEGERVVTHAPMFKLKKERLRDLALMLLIGAAALLYSMDKDKEAVAKRDFWACKSESCREQVRLDQLDQGDGSGIPDIKH